MNDPVHRLLCCFWLIALVAAPAAWGALSAPTVSADVSGATVTVQWTPVSGATGYTLYYAPYPQQSPVAQLDMGGRTSFSTSLPAGSSYYIAVKAYSGTGSSELSNISSFEIGSDAGGDGSSGANGLWEGTFTEHGVGTFEVSGLLYEGEIYAISEAANAIYVGTYALTGKKMSGKVTAYAIDGGPFATAVLSGTVTEQESISVSFETSYGSSGTMSLQFNDIYNRDSALSLVAGTWGYTSGTYSLTVAVQNDGTFFGQDSDGCVLSGTIGLIDTDQNLYEMDTKVSSCQEMNGSYTGFSALLDNAAPNDTLQVVASNSNYIVFYPLARQ